MSFLFNPIPVQIEFNDNIIHTKNLFGTIEELRTATLRLADQNDWGDCLVLVNEKYLCDIDHRDIKSVKTFEKEDFSKTMDRILSILTDL